MIEHIVTIGIQIIPKSAALETYDLIDKAIEVIQKSGIKHQITPFETVMEGDYHDIMQVCERAQKAVIDAGASECLVYYRIHYRMDGDVTFEEKRLDR
jgi:uncharacterized protein YqgV (UPF0045/DUF77 family)